MLNAPGAWTGLRQMVGSNETVHVVVVVVGVVVVAVVVAGSISSWHSSSYSEKDVGLLAKWCVVLPQA